MSISLQTAIKTEDSYCLNTEYFCLLRAGYECQLLQELVGVISSSSSSSSIIGGDRKGA
jgi:hypothetical protein